MHCLGDDTMMYDVSSVLKTEGESLSVSGKVVFSQNSLSGAGPFFGDDVCFDGTITNIGNVLEFKANVKGSFKVLCARCTKELDKTFDIDFTEMLVNSTDDISDKDAVLIFEGHEVDLDDIIESNILVNLSLKYLCSEDCKGLCPVCGADRNLTDCSCGQDEIDPRMAGLKNLLIDD